VIEAGEVMVASNTESGVNSGFIPPAIKEIAVLIQLSHCDS
jgi:hypothetical protein